MAAEITRLEKLGVIEDCSHSSGEFVSPIFLRPKKNGTFRMILNLKDINPYIQYNHFKMESLDTCIQLVTPGAFMASLDLSDAYYSVPIHHSSRKYLRFSHGGQLYQFCALPNGLTSAPRAFTKLLKPAFAHLREKEHVLSAYLDDSFAIGLTQGVCGDAISAAFHSLTELGFHVNVEKSALTPTTTLQHLGFVIDSVAMQVSLPLSKISDIKSICSHLQNTPNHTLRLVAQVLGTLVAAFPGVRYGPLHYRHLEVDKIR